MAEKPTPQIKMLHPDHETRDDDGIFYASSEVEAMTLSTRGYIRVDEKESGKGAKTAPPKGGGSSSSSGGSSDS